MILSYIYEAPFGSYPFLLQLILPFLAIAPALFYLVCRSKYPIRKPKKPILMKRRVRKIANFFAFNLLFFALYLNFIHKDSLPTAGGDTSTPTQKTASFNGTVPVDNPEMYLGKKTDAGLTSNAEQPQADKATAKDGSALKLSIN